MLVHPEELRWAQLNEKHLQFEPLTRDQIHSIMERGRELHRWYKSHHLTHSLINLVVLIFLFGSDYPIVPYPVSAGPLDRFGFADSDLQAINRGNAERLFPRLKA